MTAKRNDFPSDFVWGTATASYQIEGAALEDGRKPSIWDTFSHTPGKVKGGDTGDVACDHYHRWETDLELMAGLGMNAYRFSIAWPRIVPDGIGRANTRGLAFYDRLVDGLLARGIAPWATLYHWDLPQALQDQGGWGSKDTAHRLAEYAQVVTQALGDRVKRWITINEPWCAAYLGYGAGLHAPGLTDFGLSLRAAHHILLAHGLAMPIIRANSGNASAGITLNLNPTYPATDSSEDLDAVRKFDGFFNRWYLDPVFGRGYPADMLEQYGPIAPSPENGIVQDGDLEKIAAATDFLGVNYYSRAVVRADSSNPMGVSQVQLAGVERTFMDWEVFPQGLTELMLRLTREYGVENLFITENGASYRDAPGPTGRVEDADRTRYFERHLEASLEAIQQGAKLRGYFAWSLMDNFEWAEGYEKRFGLVHVDFATQERRLKRSAEWFRDFLGASIPEPVGN